ncbi:MAG: hypothetical protein PSV18_01860 [Methylobacter sp.]|nr:hypothetical protein [Candidatus Methylobacter titanis]
MDKDKLVIETNFPKPWVRHLGRVGGDLLFEFAKLTQLKTVEIFKIAEAINKIKLDQQENTESNPLKLPELSKKNIQDWMGKKYLNITSYAIKSKNPVQSSINNQKQDETPPFKDFHLTITDYVICAKTEKGSLLVGYEKITASLFTMIHKMKENGTPTFDENALYGFISDVKEKIPDIEVDETGKQIQIQIRMNVNLLTSNNKKINIDFDGLASNYNESESDIFEPEKGRKASTGIKKEKLSIKVLKYGAEKNEICLNEINSIDDLRSLTAKYATQINKTIKTIQIKPNQDEALEVFVKKIQWIVLDRKA